MFTSAYPADAFGDPFDLASLPLPRPAAGYAVQRLNTDQLLDQNSGNFLPVRSTTLNPVHRSFADAYASALSWVNQHQIAVDDHQLAIVPIAYDPIRERHILIYGVLCTQP